MSPRIARAEPASQMDAGRELRRGPQLKAEIDAVMRQQRAKDEDSITVARRFASAQQERDRLIAEGAPVAEIATARELVERLRREQEELVGVRAHLAAKSKALRAALVPVEAEETLAAVVTLAAHLDAAVRPIGPRVRSLLPQLVKAASAAQAAERQLSASRDERREELTAVVNAVPAIDELVKVAEAIVAYTTGTTAVRIERNAPAEAETAAASPLTPAAPAEA